VDATDVAGAYFDAWNARDAKAVAAAFHEDGVYRDPGVPDGLDPVATGGYAAGLWSAFPDLSFSVEDVTADAEGRVWARWQMTGTNSGPFFGLPPTGRPISVPGADLVRVRGDRVAEVQGFFDTGAVPRQLDMQVVVQPSQVGPFEFGTCSRVSRSGAEPGAISLTVLEARTPEEGQEVADRSRDIVLELMGRPGFISWLGITVGARMFTVTAWEDPDAVDALKGSAGHVTAMSRFYGPELAAGGQTGVWAPHRLNGLWVRCECGEMAEVSAGTCSAGHELPPAPAYW
jgi:steroid delta-isomerase-like uncharacterized protein